MIAKYVTCTEAMEGLKRRDHVANESLVQNDRCNKALSRTTGSEAAAAAAVWTGAARAPSDGDVRTYVRCSRSRARLAAAGLRVIGC
eukprot:6213482-Pleurochrysis_carterae.AAC.1